MKTPSRAACHPTLRPKTRRAFRLPDPTALALRLLLLTPALWSLPAASHAATRVWGGVNGDLWSDNGNWQGGVAPADGDDVAFGASGRTAVTDDFLARSLGVVTFDAVAPGYRLTITSGGPAGRVLTLNGAGIVNNSAAGLTQNVFVAAQTANGDPGARLEFRNSATVGAGVTITARGSAFATSPGGLDLIGSGNVRFYDTATAGRGTIINEGHAGNAVAGAQTLFLGNSSAADATVINGAGQRLGSTNVFGHGGATFFRDNASAGNAVITNAGLSQTGFPSGGTTFFNGSSTAANARITNENGGQVVFDDSSRMGASTIRNLGGDAGRPDGAYTTFQGAAHGDTAAVTLEGATAGGAKGAQLYVSANANLENATVTANGANVPGGGGSLIQVDGPARAGNATLIANGGTNGGGGATIFFFNTSRGDTARAIVNAGATLDNSGYQSAAFSIGSIEGAGTFAIGAFSNGGGTFTVGANDRSTTVSGVIQNGGQFANNVGTLIKTGAGTLTLSGANTYTGSTTVNAGGLRVDGSVTGSGVSVASGALLGGGGTINAPVTVGFGGTLAPGRAAAPGTLATGSLTLAGGSNLNFRLGAPGVVGGASNDLLTVSGNLTLAGNLNVADSGGFGLGTYRLINYSGGLTNNGLNLGTIPAGFSPIDFSVQTSLVGQVNLVVGNGTNVLFWDGAQTVANNAVNGGTASWNNGATNWTNAGGAVNVAWGNRFAVFTGAAGTVTVTEPVTSTGMQFVTDGYTVNANPGASIALAGATTIRVDPGAAAAIGAPLTGAGSLTKLDSGTLILRGDSTYTGGTTVQDGIVMVTNPAGLGLGAGPVVVLATATSELRYVNLASAGSVAITTTAAPSGGARSLLSFYDAATAGSATIENQGSSAAGGGLGGLTIFTNSSTAGTATILNRGGVAGVGLTLFQNTTSAGSATFVNEGGTVPGSSPGSVIFSDSASAGSATFTNRGATVASAPGGSLNFQISSTAGSATILNAGGTVAGGGSAITQFSGFATAGSANLTSQGGTVAGGGPGITRFGVSATAGSATITADGGSATGAAGGQTVFDGSANAASATLIANGGSNGGAGGSVLFQSNAGGGTARAVLNAGGNLDLSGLTPTGLTLGSVEGAGNVFLGSKNLTVGTNNLSTAFAGVLADGGVSGGAGGRLTKTGLGTLTLSGVNTYTGGTVVADGKLLVTDPGGGGLGAGPVTVRATPTSELRFIGTASAGGVSITNNPGPNGAGTGVTQFRDTATAGTASVTNQASTVAGGLGGLLFFGGDSRAGSARIANLGATVDDNRLGNSGFTTFSGAASAASAVIDNYGSAVPGTVGGLTQFMGASTAGASTITNRRGISPPATFGLGGETRFSDDSLGGAATILNAAGDPDGTGGALTFTDRANAQNARITNQGAAVAFVGGATSFTGTASAGQATLTQGSAATIQGDGGRLNFYDDTRAGGARIVNNGAPAAAGGNPATTAGGVTTFYGNSSADGAALVNEAGTGPSGGFARRTGGTIAFLNNATAGSATIDNRGGVPAVSGGRVTFDNTSTAGAAAITNGGGLSPSTADGEAELTFSGASNAGTAAIVNQGGTLGTSEGGATFFQGTSSASAATITNRGAAVSGAGGGRTFFAGSSSAGTATLSAEGGAPGGTGGGSIVFLENSTANLARVILAGGGPGVSPGGLDIGGLTFAGTTIGSIEGGGVISLGGKVLATGFNNRSTTFSGLIRDGGLVNATGGSLRVLGSTGAGTTLTLSGANTYTGGTTIGDGSNADSGKLIVTNTIGSATGAGAVTIQKGGTLSGSGFIAGPVTLQAGGTLAPGDPVTLTLQDSLTWDGGSTIRLVLGADQAGSDLLEISGALIRGDASGGLFIFDLVDAGAVVGQTYDFVHFGSIEGFSVSDFTFTGVAGTFALQDGELGFTVTGVVPEPAVVWLVLVPGALLLLRRARQQRGATARSGRQAVAQLGCSGGL